MYQGFLTTSPGVKLLLDAGAKIDRLTKDAMSPYTMAVTCNMEIADYLLSRGANPEFRLHYLAYNGAVDAMHDMLLANPLQNLQDDAGRTALFWAMEGKRPESIRLLLEARSDVNLR